MFNYQDKVVIVTGSSSGIGLEMAHAYADAGATVVLTARRIEKLQDIAKEMESKGVKVLPVPCDVTKTEEIENLVQEVVSTYGKIDVLVNNAGTTRTSPIDQMSDEDWSLVIDTDLNSVFKMTRAVSRVMKENGGGKIINIASMHGLTGTNQANSAYHAAKAGVINFTRAAAAEFGPYQINVNAICPGFFPTELMKEEVLKDEAFQSYMDFTVPLKRAGKPGELNGAAIFLGSDAANYITGAILPVDGGWSASK